jgi:hypothetical protein
MCNAPPNAGKSGYSHGGAIKQAFHHVTRLEEALSCERVILSCRGLFIQTQLSRANRGGAVYYVPAVGTTLGHLPLYEKALSRCCSGLFLDALSSNSLNLSINSVVYPLPAFTACCFPYDLIFFH